jgi:ribose-phosphate pyrophosphokinase
MELGARNIYLYITHCENSVLDGEMIESDLIQRIYTTDTIFTAQHPKIEVFKRFR